MARDTFFEGLINSLTEEQKTQIRDHFVNYDAEYVTFYVSVCNAGVATRIEFSNSPVEFDESSWNGYDVCLSMDEVATLIYRYDK